MFAKFCKWMTLMVICFSRAFCMLVGFIRMHGHFNALQYKAFLVLYVLYLCVMYFIMNGDLCSYSSLYGIVQSGKNIGIGLDSIASTHFIVFRYNW